MMASERDPIPCPVCREVIIGPLSAAVHLSDMHGLSMYGALARLTRELEESRRERSAARAEALTAQASLRRVERELEEARNHARRVVVALRAICDEAAIGGPPLERRREEWEAALSEADEVLGELEALYGAR